MMFGRRNSEFATITKELIVYSPIATATLVKRGAHQFRNLSICGTAVAICQVTLMAYIVMPIAGKFAGREKVPTINLH